jgi:cell fate (sporulation/competence/biofilm development) regulator YlbF (YheA/YmcA/DUF963 family)
MFNKETIEKMTRAETESAIRQFERKYDLEHTIVRYTDDVDALVNTLCNLNRRIEEIVSAEGYEKAAETIRANKSLINRKM